MKHTFALLAEVLALPLSEQLLEEDYITNCIGQVFKEHDNGDDTALAVHLEKKLSQVYWKYLSEVNTHTAVSSITEFQGLIDYVYKPEMIIKLGKRKQPYPELSGYGIARLFFVCHIISLAKTFISNRDGKATLKFWAGASEASKRGSKAPAELEELGIYDVFGETFKINRIEAWNSLLQCIPEDLMLSAYVAYLVKQANNARKDDACYELLLTFKDRVHLADVLLDKILDKGMAENHIHSGASKTFGMIWEKTMENVIKERRVLRKDYDRPYKRSALSEEYTSQALEAFVLRTMLAYFLRNEVPNGQTLSDFICSKSPFKKSLGFYRQLISALEDGQKTSCYWSEAIGSIHEFLESFHISSDKNIIAQVLNIDESYKLADPGLPERFFNSMSMLYCIEHPEDETFSAFYIRYLRLKNCVYRFRVQDAKNKGLSYFQRYYSQSTDESGEESCDKTASIVSTALRDKRIIKTEFRLTPPSNVCVGMEEAVEKTRREIKKQIKLIIKQHLFVLTNFYGKRYSSKKDFEIEFDNAWAMTDTSLVDGKTGEIKKFLQRFNLSADMIPAHRIGIVYHMLKRGESSENAACFINGIAQSRLDEYGAFSFGKSRFEYDAVVTAITNIRALSPALGRMLLAIDAASQEIPTEPWVFAPSFRRARELNASIPAGKADSLIETKLLGITYHVGEDFRHPIAGLRHIDEAIEFFKMHAGDRIGHGLALGINIDDWYSNRALIAMPVVEWMENCLWAWSVLLDVSDKQKEAASARILESQIMMCAEKIYGTLDGISIEKLYNSYKNKTLGFDDLRRLRDKLCMKEKFEKINCFSNIEKSTYFPCSLNNTEQKNSFWSEDALSMSYHCELFKRKMKKTIIIETSDDMIELSKQLQIYVRAKVASRGLIVESNPSSNAVIGDMNGILQHPLREFRGENECGKAIMVTINTDDPSVFNASIANEHAYAYYAMQQKGYTVEAALEQIDKMRQLGLDTSFVCDVKSFDEVLEDYEEIIYALG